MSVSWSVLSPGYTVIPILAVTKRSAPCSWNGRFSASTTFFATVAASCALVSRVSTIANSSPLKRPTVSALLTPRGPRDDHRELVSAQPFNDGAIALAPGETLLLLFQQLVAGRVSERVVHV